MAGIVDVYRKHKDLLLIYFNSEEEAANCERRAEMGDDRAMRIMSLTYDLKRKQEYKYVSGTDDGGDWSVDEDEPGFSRFSSKYHKISTKLVILNKSERDSYNARARGNFNIDALDFLTSTIVGNRKATISLPELHCSLRGFPADILRSKGSVRYELSSPANFLSPVEGSSNFHILFFHPKGQTIGPHVNPLWVTDANSMMEDEFIFSDRYINPLETCARAGSIESAYILQGIYSQPTFYQKVVDRPLFGKKKYQHNPIYDMAKAKEWQRIVDHLEGKSSTSFEREQFLKNFLYSQDRTPEGVYNIGYALYHNKQIGDISKGIDYLKHAANLDNANASRELGEIYHDRFDDKGESNDLFLAHFWYQVAAKTSMKVTNGNGKVELYDGHPNAKARVQYLENAYPIVLDGEMNEKEVRNPSAQHIAQYPASAWQVDIPRLNLSDLHNPAAGNIIARMEKAVEAIDASVSEFENAVSGIQAKIDELGARQLVLQGKVDSLNAEELDTLRFNDKLSASQRVHERAAQHSHNRWVRETAMNLGSTVIMTYLTAGTSEVAVQFGRNVSRAMGFKGASNNEIDYQKALIKELEERKIDTTKFPHEIAEIAKSVQEIADSKPIKKLLQDKIRAQAIIAGYLRQRILTIGLENSRSLAQYAKNNGITSLEALLAEFEKGDARLFTAINHLCYGHANSNDIEVILIDANDLKGNVMSPYKITLKQYVERVMKDNIGCFMMRASQIDVIEELELVDFKTMGVNDSKDTSSLIQSTIDGGDKAATLALTMMFAKQFGVAYIGQYDVNRMFSFYLHRHGNRALIADELYDGVVSDKEQAKEVSIRSADSMRDFVERVKKSAFNEREDLPDVGNLFLRVCGYEYFLPQAIITSGRGNRFRENPEAPVAYPMVNEVISKFIERIGLTITGLQHLSIGKEIDAVIAQTFIDFFQAIGTDHATKFEKDRAYLRESFAKSYYGPRFTTYLDMIVHDAIQQFQKFMEIYERDLQKHLQVMTDADAMLLVAQIRDIPEPAQTYLSPKVNSQGRSEAVEKARKLNHRGSNMTEQWLFPQRFTP